jgi:hypothetical protein
MPFSACSLALSKFIGVTTEVRRYARNVSFNIHTL